MSQGFHDERKSVNAYCNDVGRFPVLAADEEKEVAIKAKAGDKEAIDKLVVSNLKLVALIAKKYRGYGLSYLDLIQEGNIALILSTKTFDPTRGIRFGAYASKMINWRIPQALYDKGNIVKVPSYIQKRKYRQDKYMRKLGKGSDNSAEILRTKFKKNYVESVANKYLYLDAPILNEYNDKTKLSVALNDPASARCLDELEHTDSVMESRVGINKSLNKLERRNRLIVEQVFGLNGKKRLNYVQVARLLGISRQRIEQVLKTSFRHIKHHKALKQAWESLN